MTRSPPPTIRATAVLFDFDGTLIDSAHSVLASLQHALQIERCTPRQPLVPDLIGPPLRRTLITLVGDEDPALIDRLAQRFREHYDTAGYRETQVFAGVPELLQTLHQAEIPLYIVTNKRISATRRILEHLDWLTFFTGLYALDAFDPPLAHKPAVVRAVLQRHALDPASTWMVGDSDEDQRAAEVNGLAFFAARWGYGAAAQVAAHRQSSDDIGKAQPGDLLYALG